MKRRIFMGASAAAAAMQVHGANDRVVLGIVGCGGRGSYVATEMVKGGAEYGAVCDVYEANSNKAKGLLNPQAKQYSDFRKLLENKDIDAVHIATPDHWHAIPTIMACQAGKDVYVEKPLAHNVREGAAMIRAARQYKRIVQTGTQHRSAPHYAELAKLVQSGAIGEVRFVRVWNYINIAPLGIGTAPDGDPPAGLDWDFWLGPAPKVPFNPKRFLGTYRWFRDYSGGFITDYGTHRFDTVHQIMAVDTPTAVSASGGRFVLRDQGDVPDTLMVTYEYPSFVMNYECMLINGHGLGGRTPGMKYYNARSTEDRPHGEAYYGTDGTIFADRVGYDIYPETGSRSMRLTPGGSSVPERPPKVDRKWTNTTDATGLHAKAFVEALKSRGTPPGEVAIGHKSTIIPHLGNIALATGRKLRWDGAKEDFVGDAEASKLLGRKARKPWDLV